MRKKMIIMVVLILLLVACGGGGADGSPTLTPTSGDANITDSQVTETPDTASVAATETPVTESNTEGNGEAATPTPEGESVETPATEELQMSGTDPDTGLEINPEQIVAGVEFIVRGEIASMTLIPQDAPEFVLISPAGVRYRFRPQPLDQIFYEDGSQLAVHEYQLGLMASATIYKDPAEGPTAVATSSNMMLHHTDN